MELDLISTLAFEISTPLPFSHISLESMCATDVSCSMLIPILAIIVHRASVEREPRPVHDLYSVRAGADLHVPENGLAILSLPFQIYSIPQAGAGSAGIAAEPYLFCRAVPSATMRPNASNPPAAPSNTIVTPGSIVSVAVDAIDQQVGILDDVDESRIFDRRSGSRYRALNRVQTVMFCVFVTVSISSVTAILIVTVPGVAGAVHCTLAPIPDAGDEASCRRRPLKRQRIAVVVDGASVERHGSAGFDKALARRECDVFRAAYWRSWSCSRSPETRASATKSAGIAST